MISEIEEPDGQKLSFEYEGTLPTRTTWTGEVNGSVGREYDENFRVTSLDVNGQDPAIYTYDDDNLLTSAGELTITRDPESGREVETQLGNVKTERTYTTFGEPETYTAKFGETELYYEHYTYNKLGWITDLERRQNGLRAAAGRTNPLVNAFGAGVTLGGAQGLFPKRECGCEG